MVVDLEAAFLKAHPAPPRPPFDAARARCSTDRDGAARKRGRRLRRPALRVLSGADSAPAPAGAFPRRGVPQEDMGAASLPHCLPSTHARPPSSLPPSSSPTVPPLSVPPSLVPSLPPSPSLVHPPSLSLAHPPSPSHSPLPSPSPSFPLPPFPSLKEGGRGEGREGQEG